jgi:hypothetical protein
MDRATIYFQLTNICTAYYCLKTKLGLLVEKRLERGEETWRRPWSAAPRLGGGEPRSGCAVGVRSSHGTVCAHGSASRRQKRAVPAASSRDGAGGCRQRAGLMQGSGVLNQLQADGRQEWSWTPTLEQAVLRQTTEGRGRTLLQGTQRRGTGDERRSA